MASDIKTAVIRFNSPGSSGNQSVAHGLSWTPKVALFIMSRSNTEPTRNGAGMGYGAGSGTSDDWSTAVYCNDSNPTSARRDHVTTGAISLISTAVGDRATFQATAFDGTNIYLNWTTANNSGFHCVAVLFGGDDLEFASGTLTPSASTDGTVTETIGFQADLVLFSTVGNAAGGGIATASTHSFGAARRSTLVNRCYMHATTDNVATTASAEVVSETYCGGQLNAAGSIAWAAEVDQFTSTAFRVVSRLAGAGGDSLSYLALKLGDRSVWLGSIDSPTSSDSTWTVTTPAFKPQLALLGMTLLASYDSISTTTTAVFGGSCVFSPTTMYTVGQFMGDNITAGSGGMQAVSDDDMRSYKTSGSTSTAAMIYNTQAFTSSGWTMSRATATTATYKWFGLAIQEVPATLSVSVSDTATVSDSPVVFIDDGGLVIIVSDTATVSESVSLALSIALAVADTATLSELVTIAKSISDPLDIASTVLWLDPGSLALSDGNAVSAWSDETANNNDASQGTGALQPVYRDGTDRHHGRPMVDFNDDQLIVADAASLSNGTVTYTVVVDVTDFAGSEAGFILNKAATESATAALRCLSSPTGFDGGVRLSGSTSTFRQVTDDVNYEQGAVILMLIYDGSTLKLYVENKLVDSLSVSGAVDTASGNLSIGNHPTTTTAGLVGRIGDVVVNSEDLNDGDRTNLYTWLRDKYPLPTTRQGLALSSVAIRSCSIARDDANSQFVMAYVGQAGNVYYATAPYSDPNNWTDSATQILSGANIRGTCLLKVGSTWYLYYDSATAGTISVATGSTITSLSNYGGNPILSGTGTGNEQYVRHPYVIEESGSWVMLYDGRNGSAASGVGALYRATSSDGLSWSRDAVVLTQDGEGFEDTDITAPSLRKIGNQYVLAYGGFNDDGPDSRGDATHQFRLARSSDTSSWTRDKLDPWPLHNRESADKFVQGNPELHYTPTNGKLWVYYEIENSSLDSRQAWLYLATIDHFVSVSDAATVSESVTLELSDPSLAVTASDTATLTESLAEQLVAFVFVSDTATLSESATTLLVAHAVVSDTATVSEDTTVQPVIFVVVSDTATLSESVTVVVAEADAIAITVSDTTTLSEASLAALLSFVAVNDTATTTDDPTPHLISFVAISDTVTLTESVTPLLVSLVAVSDTATLSESATSDLVVFVVVSDSSTLSESVTVTVVDEGVIVLSVSDAITLTETASIAVSDPTFSVSDTTSVTESVTPHLIGFVAVSDSTTLSESLSALLVILVQASESVTLTEGLSFRVDIALALADTATLTESITVDIVVPGSALSLIVSESATIAESVLVRATVFGPYTVVIGGSFVAGAVASQISYDPDDGVQIV